MRLSLLQAIHSLHAGNVIAVPTETVYGLAACVDQPRGIEQIFALKGRPRINPLIIHMADVEQMKAYAAFYPPGFEELARAFLARPIDLRIVYPPFACPRDSSCWFAHSRLSSAGACTDAYFASCGRTLGDAVS